MVKFNATQFNAQLRAAHAARCGIATTERTSGIPSWQAAYQGVEGF